MKQAKLARQKAHRVSLQRNLLTSLVLHKRLVTTEAKAKQIKPLADRLLHQARADQGLNTKRRLASTLVTNQAVKELFTVIVPNLPAKNGSLVKLVKVAPRVGDQANQAALIISKKPEPEKKPAKSKKDKTSEK